MWTMEQLVERVRAALAAEYPGAPNGRVRDVPDRRSIRWYTTIGIVDRPLPTGGRVALYGPRHLQQLVAIKRRQAAGRTLSEIQAELAGASDEQLAAAARVPADLLVVTATPEQGPARTEFWKQPAGSPPGDIVTRPALPAAELVGDTFHTESALPANPEQELFAFPLPDGALDDEDLRQVEGVGARGDAVSLAGLLSGLPLGGGVILLIPQPITETDRGEIVAAARPLLDLLASRGLTDGRDA